MIRMISFNHLMNEVNHTYDWFLGSVPIVKPKRARGACVWGS